MKRTTAPPPITTTPSPTASPSAPPSLPKQVSFNPHLTTFLSDSTPPASPSTPSTPTPTPPPFTRRRSSLKEGGVMPSLPPPETYQHSDPLLRRLRLRDGKGDRVDLKRAFGEEVKVVLVLFGATWNGSSREYFTLVEEFAKQHPHRMKVIYCSVDSDEATYERNTRGKAWYSMEWNDGSNLSTDDPLSPLSGLPDSPTSLHSTTLPEPFLHALSPDLEHDLSHSDSTGSLYLRPFSRVYLSQKWNVLGVPSLWVYHTGLQEVIGRNVRPEMIRGEKGEGTWESWERGETVEWGLKELMHALRWTLGAGVVAAAYVVAVRVGGVDDVLSNLSRQLTSSYLGAP